MTSTERKRIWRREHPEQSQEAERVRAAKRRRHGCIIAFTPGTPPEVFVYPSGESYQRYEDTFDFEKNRRGIGRRASRWRAYLKSLRTRIAVNRTKLAAAYAELGLGPDASIEEDAQALIAKVVSAE